MRVAATLVLLASLLPLLPRRVRADDWLASLPACSFGASASLPSYALIYPRPGLPAVVEAGQSLVARVRLPAPLTPPPGIQQPRALVGWRAELIGHAWPLLPAASLEQRQPLEVVDVRPDSAASLIYRASIPIPAWVAPGSYDFGLWAPGGNAVALAGLRVLAPGSAPRLAWLDRESAPSGTAAIAALPVDVWVEAAASPSATAAQRTTDAALAELAPAPSLDLRGAVAALRIGSGLWAFGACESGGLSFADEVKSVLEREHRTRFWPSARQLAPGQFQPFDAGARSWPGADAVQLTRAPDQVRIQVGADFPGAAELGLLLLGDERRTEVRGATLRFYPAGEIALAAPPALIAALRVPAGGRALVTRALAATFQPQLRVQPELVRSGEPVNLSVAGAATKIQVAWRLDHVRTVFGPSAIEPSFRPLGQHRVVALVLAEDGRARKLEAGVRVRTAQASGCGCSLGSTRAERSWRSSRAGLLLLTVAFGLRRHLAKKTPR